MFMKGFKLQSIPQSMLDTAYVGVGSVISAFFSYLLIFFLGKNLSLEDFGSYNALLSISYLVGVPATVFSISIAKAVSEFYSQDDRKKITGFFIQLTCFSLLVGLCVAVLFLLLGNFLARTIQLSDSAVVVVFGLLMGLGFLGSVTSPYFQGLLRYKTLSFFTVLSSLLRFIFPAIFVCLGYRLLGVFWGMSLGAVISFFCAYFLLKPNFVRLDNIWMKFDYKRILLFSFSAFLVTICLVALNNTDMILVKKYFDGVSSGYYAGVVTLGKILLFGSGIVSTVMFPAVSALHTQNGNYQRKFKQFLLIQVSAVLIGLLMFFVFPGQLTKLFFGNSFYNSVQYLPLFAIYIAGYVLVNFLVMFLLAIRKTQVCWVLIPGALLLPFLITIFHENLFQVIYMDLLIITFTLVGLVIYVSHVLSREEHE